MVVARRPPNTNALIGTPSGSLKPGSMMGLWARGAVNRAVGCAAGLPVAFPVSGVHTWPCQSRHSAGGSSVIPSHHTPPSRVRATLVKIAFFLIIAIAFGLVYADVPGATPNTPVSGLIARSRPSASGLIHAMSSPTIVTFQSRRPSGGIIIARLVLPHALGNAAAM